MKKILLVDGSSLAFRMFFALERMGLTSPDGKPSWAIYGFIRALFDSISQEKPDGVLVAFDSKGKTFRAQQFDYYKANRPDEMPEALQAQWPEIQLFLKHLGVSCEKRDGVEADDIIGTYARIAEKAGYHVDILTGDKDIFQLVTKDVHVLYPSRKGGLERYTEEKVFEKMGVRPNQVVDYKAFSGDPSDNIKGVPGVGPKTTTTLLGDYDTLEGVYEHITEIKDSLQKKLVEHKQNALDSQFLATIKVDYEPLETLDSICSLHPDSPKLTSFIQSYAMKSITTDLPKIVELLGGDAIEISEEENVKQKIVYSVQETTAAKVLAGPYIGIYMHENDTMICSAYEGSIWIAPYSEKVNFQGKKIYTWDAKKIYTSHPELLLQNIADCRVGTSLLDSTTNPDYAKTLQKYIEQDEITDYHICLFAEHLEKNIQGRVYRAWSSIENTLAKTLFNMEQRGVTLDVEKVTNISKILDTEIAKWDEQIKNKLNNRDINLQSSSQLGEALAQAGFTLKKTKTGKYSTDKNTLDTLLDKDTTGIISDILEFRTVTKLRSTYTDTLIKECDENNKIHTEYNQTGAATGRLASINPNLQNIPIKNPEYGPKFRACFTAAQGNSLIVADYSQIELRFLAHFTQDPLLCEAFSNNEDIHARTASEILHIPISQVTSDQRRIGKTLNFALVYQQGAYTTSKMLEISVQEAKTFIDRYFTRFAKVKPFIESSLEKARDLGYSETFWGRRRYFKNLKSSAALLRAAEERAAFNAILQGSSADLTKLAMNEIEKELSEYTHANSGTGLIMQVHDEVVFEVVSKDADDIQKQISNILPMSQPLYVPIEVSVATGNNWNEAK